MRQPRLKAPPGPQPAYYHCLSRVVERRHHFGDAEKGQFVALMHEYAEFCEVRVLTFCIMDNHFCDGAVLGSREYVEGVFRGMRERFGPRRRSGALHGAAISEQ